MSTRKLTPDDLQRITQAAKEWGKIVVRRAYGDQGPGLDVDLAHMEQIAQAAARGIIAGTLEVATTQQSQLLGDQQACPTCGRLCPVASAGRPVQVSGGSFEHREPVCHCPTCRRDFFPSTSPAETRHARL